MQQKERTPVYIEPFVRRHRPFFVSLFVIVPVLMIPTLLMFTMLKIDLFQQWRTLHVVYGNTQGLKKGNPVSMSGTTVGHVRSVELIKEREVHVSINVNSRYNHLVRRDTRARLKQRGFVGDWEIELIGGSAAYGEAAENDTLSAENMLSMDDIIELAGGIIDTGIILLNYITAIVKGLEDGEGVMGQLLKNDTMFDYVSKHVDRIGYGTSGLLTDVRKLTVDAQGIAANTARNVDSMLTSFTNVGNASAAFVDTLGTLINSVNASIAEVDQILKNVKTVSNEAPELMDRLMHDLGEVEQMLRTFQDGWLFRSIGGGAPKNPHLAETP